MRRSIFIVALAGIVVALSVISPVTPSPSPSPDAVEAHAPDAFDKLTGTIKGTYHQSFTDYVQTSDAVTTATAVWEEDEDYLDESCHCRPFFPTGTIDWSYRYEVKSESIDCIQTVERQVAAGTGLLDKGQQMIILWEVPGDDTQYYFSGGGQVEDSGVINCEGEGPWTAYPVDFLAIGEPEVVTTTPTFPPRIAPAGSVPMCDGNPFKIAIDEKRIKGSCYESYSDDEFSLEYLKYEWDLEVDPQPIIFIHGFLGSEIKCGGDELWPNIHALPPSTTDFAAMGLAADGISPAPGACAASVGEIVQEVAGSNVYKTTVDVLNQLRPGSVYFFNWDWRKGPQQSLASLASKIGFVRAQHDNAEVVLMAHSYGGLLARLYVDDPGRAEAVARVVTIGTPAMGSPKALFPLYAGVETPEFSPLDLLVDNDDLYEFAKNLAGAYFLYPSQNYDLWLTVGAYPAMPLGQQGVLDYVTQLGGNASLLSQALALHSSTLDPAYVPGPGDPKFEVIVGTGLPTIASVKILPGGWVQLTYDNGDGTVPARSAARGATGSGNPNKDRTHYSCYVDHVALPGDSQITTAIDDYLKYGDDIEGLTSPCGFGGVQARLFDLPSISRASAGGARAAAASVAGGAISIEDAVLQGLVDYLDLPNEKFIIAGGEIPEIALPQGKFLEVTPLSDSEEDGKGQPLLYGPLSGQVTLSVGAGGVVVLVDGEPAPIHGDVDCDEAITASDVLGLLWHAGGTPLAQPGDCAEIGSGSPPFGDIDCDGSVSALDALADLRIVAGARLDFLAACP
jgi:pimeloyl-ACP methyl ester carboxylesterase